MARDTRMCRLTIDGSGVTWKLVTIARQPRPDTATSCSICNFIIWFHDRAASWCQSIITRDSHPDKFAVCPTAHPLHLSIQYLLNIYTQYLHSIYTIFTLHLLLYLLTRHGDPDQLAVCPGGGGQEGELHQPQPPPAHTPHLLSSSAAHCCHFSSVFTGSV